MVFEGRREESEEDRSLREERRRGEAFEGSGGRRRGGWTGEAV
jgi:hypothetical protein